MKRLSTRISLFAIIAMALLSSCHDVPEYKDDNAGNFEALWQAVDCHYCFFSEKEIDWDRIGQKYRQLVTPETSAIGLFDICADMLDELRDGHVNLSAPFNTSYYRQWWTDYPQDFSLRTLQEYYLKFEWNSVGGIIYKKLSNSTGYIYYPSFSSGISQTGLDYALALMADCDVLIFDIRDNGGGLLSNIETLVGRFISRETTAGFISHKTGPGHDDFSTPYPVVYSPADSRRVKWLKPVIVLTNRSCFSSANDFVATMKGLDGVTIVGARTGGGGGLPFSSELPNGWSVRFSACPIFDRDGNSTEAGIDPDQGCEMHASEEELAHGKDAILDFAIQLAIHTSLSPVNLKR